MGCLSITQLPSFSPPPKKKKIAGTDLFYPGGESHGEIVKDPAHQLNPVTQPWFEPETRSSRVSLTSRASRHILRNCSRGRSSKPANFVQFGEISIVLTIKTINIAISNCSFYAHT